MQEKKIYELTEVLRIVPMSRAGLYKACAEGKIATVKVGRRIFVPAWQIDELVNKPPQSQGA